MEIHIGADYKGFEKKNKLMEFLGGKGYNLTDEGAFGYHEGDDFNEPAIAVAKAVRENRGAVGILICDSAHGVTMQANRFKGARAAHCENEKSAQLAREHDDANILCLSAGSTSEEEMQKISLVFLETNFVNLERRVRRINRLDEREDYD